MSTHTPRDYKSLMEPVDAQSTTTDETDESGDIETVEIDGTEYVKKKDHDAVIEEQNEQIEEQSSLLDALRNKVATLEEAFNDYRADNERDKAKIRQRITEEDGSSDLEGGVNDGKTPTQSRKSGIEQICGLPDDMAHKQLPKNAQRARYIALRIKSLGTNTNQGGFSIKSGKLKHVLDDYDKSGHTQTVSRVMDFLKDFGDDTEIKTKITKEGKRLVWFDLDLVERLSEIVPDETTDETTRVVIGGRG